MEYDLQYLIKKYESILKIHEKEYLKIVHEYPCVSCLWNKRQNYKDIHAHHEQLSLVFLHRKRTTDFVAIPLCKSCHMKRHEKGFERFWKLYNLEYLFGSSVKMLEEFFSIKNKYKFSPSFSDLKYNREMFDNFLFLSLKKIIDLDKKQEL